MTNASTGFTRISHIALMVLLSFLLLLTTANVAYSYRTKSGNVSGETWESDTYYVSGDVIVEDGETLTIKAGTTRKTVVKFAPDAQMLIKGTLDVNGADGNEVIFTSVNDDIGEGIPEDTGSPAAGDWRGIHLDGTGDNDGIGKFDHCRIRYGGKGSFHSSASFKDSNGNIGKVSCNVFFSDSSSGSFSNSVSEHSARYGMFIHTCSPSITDSAFADNAAHGVFVHTSSPKIANSTFTKNATHGMYIYIGSPKIANSTFADNASHGVHVYSGSPDIAKSAFANNGEYGLNVQDPMSAPVITDSSFMNNGGYGVLLDGVTLSSYSGNTGSGNGIHGFWVKGTVNSNSTWSIGSSTFPFVVFGGVTVANGATLTLSEGAVVKCNSAGELVVKGTLDINGTSWGENAFVVLSSLKDDSYGGNTDGVVDSPAAGDWRGIHLDGSGDNNGVGEFDYCIIRYGGGGSFGANVFFNDSSSGSFINSISGYSAKHGVHVYSCSPNIADSRFANNGEHGLYVQDPMSAPAITGGSFENNGGYGVLLDGVTLTSYSGNTGSGNGIHGFWIKGIVNANSTWSIGSSSFPFVVLNKVAVADGATLCLSAGTIVKFAPDGEFIVNGTLDVNGTSWSEGDLAVFTSLKDDRYGGDTDGAADSPAAGDWRGIHLDGSGDNDGVGEFDYCVIRYGGGGSFGANVFFDDSSSGSFSNGMSEYSAKNGVSVYNCSPDIANSRFTNNAENGLYAQGTGSAPVITGSSFVGNGGYGVLLDGVILTSYSGNTGSGNGSRGFGVNGTVSADSTWSVGSSTFPFVILGSIKIAHDATLTLSPGTTIDRSPSKADE
jgi:hypothetical protein